MILDQDGVKVFYEVHGARTDRLPVLLTHGMSATSAMWRPNLGELSADRQIITWDMRGHGQTASPEDQSKYSEAHTVADMTAILDAVGVERAVVGGLSLGGYMTLAFNLAHPERVAAVMLFDTGPGYKRDEPRDAWNIHAEETARQFSERGLAALSGSAEVRHSDHRGASGLARAARGMLKQVDARVIMSLPDITVPTLVLVGADDSGFLTSTDYMAAKIPGAVKVVLLDAGHAANIDQPEAFNGAVIDFLAGI